MCVNLSCFNVELLHIGYSVNNQEGFVINISSLRKVAFIVLYSFIRYLVNYCIEALCNTIDDFTKRCSTYPISSLLNKSWKNIVL